MPLFEVAIVENPTEKDAKDGKEEVLVFGPRTVVAKSSDVAGLKALLVESKELAKFDYNRLQVFVRPFV